MLHTPSSQSAGPPSMRRRRRVPSRLDPVTLAALRDILAPPSEREADAERAVADIMARVHSAGDVAIADGGAARSPRGPGVGADADGR